MNFSEMKKALREISLNISRNKNDFLLLAGKDLEGRMKSRIFNRGKNSKEEKIGDYKSKFWIKIRQKGNAGLNKKKKGRKSSTFNPKYRFKGRQVGYVDLEYSGELRNSIQVVKDSSGVAMAVIDDHNYDKAMGQEIIQGKKAGAGKMEIFIPSKKEEKAVQRYVEDLIDEEIENALKKFR